MSVLNILYALNWNKKCVSNIHIYHIMIAWIFFRTFEIRDKSLKVKVLFELIRKYFNFYKKFNNWLIVKVRVGENEVRWVHTEILDTLVDVVANTKLCIKLD